MKCVGCGAVGLDREKCLLQSAIANAPCIYCLAKPGDPCMTCTGKECPQWHIQRVHAGHLTLVGMGTPCGPRELAELRFRPSKGHVRRNWHRSKRRLNPAHSDD